MSPNVLNRLPPSISQVLRHYVIDNYQELRGELSALKQSVDAWETTAWDDKGGTSEPQERVT